MTEDTVENGVAIENQDKNFIEISPEFDTNKKLYCEIISWDNTKHYSNIASISSVDNYETYEIVFKNPNGEILIVNNKITIIQ